MRHLLKISFSLFKLSIVANIVIGSDMVIAHQSDPSEPVHQYLAGEAWQLLPDSAMKTELQKYIGNKINYSIDGVTVTTYTGLFNNENSPASWTPSDDQPTVPYSEFSTENFESGDIERCGDLGEDNLTVGSCEEPGDDIIEGSHEEDLFRLPFADPDAYRDIFWNGQFQEKDISVDQLPGAFMFDGAELFINHLWTRPNHSGTNETGLITGKEFGTVSVEIGGITLNVSFGSPSAPPVGIAEKYWNEAIVNYADSSQRDLAYYYLGRVTHYLVDLTVPAHSHADGHPKGLIDDQYELYMGSNYFKYSFLDAQPFSLGDLLYDKYEIVSGEGPKGKQFNKTSTKWTGTKSFWESKSQLYKLFWYTAEVADSFASDTIDGELDGGVFRINSTLCENAKGELNNNLLDLVKPLLIFSLFGDKDELNKVIEIVKNIIFEFEDTCDIQPDYLPKIGESLMPLAMQVTAELYRLFWEETHPELLENIEINDSVAEQRWKFYSVVANEGYEIEVEVSEISGDIGLYVAFNQTPMLENFDCESNNSSISEICVISSENSGTWIVGVLGIEPEVNEFSINVTSPDSDLDGVGDNFDAFPLNVSEVSDLDGDGVGDNVDEDDDGDNMPDFFENENGLESDNPNDAFFDKDMDGLSNLEEFLAGRDPTINEEAVILIINSTLDN